MGLALAALMAAAALPAAAAETPAVLNSDPLMKQIHHRMMQPDGGVSTVTWVKDSAGRPMAIPLVDSSVAGAALNGAAAPQPAGAGALNGLAQDHRLAAAHAKSAGAAGKGRVKAPTKQLHKIDEQRGW